MKKADTFSALSDPIRRDVLVLLKEGYKTAGELAKELEISSAALSYHFKILKQADLVMEYKYKNFVYYQLNTTVLDEVILWVKQLGGKDHEK